MTLTAKKRFFIICETSITIPVNILTHQRLSLYYIKLTDMQLKELRSVNYSVVLVFQLWSLKYEINAISSSDFCKHILRNLVFKIRQKGLSGKLF